MSAVESKTSLYAGALTRPSRLRDGVLRVPLPADLFGFPERVSALVVEKGHAARPTPLGELHRSVDEADTRLGEHYSNRVSAALYERDPVLHASYLELVRYLAREVLDFDFVFQAYPVFRFHFPGPFPDSRRLRNGHAFELHSDTMGGHPFEMLNVWVPLTACSGAAALQLAPLEPSLAILRRFHEDPHVAAAAPGARLRLFYDRIGDDEAWQSEVVAACRPVEMKPGECLLFDARAMHGGAENVEALTRVSLDFRILAVEDRAQGARSDVWASQSARQL